MHNIYVTYTTFRSTNLKILDSIWVVIAQMFCMLQHTTFSKNAIVDEPKYTKNTSVYCVTVYVCILWAAVKWVL